MNIVLRAFFMCCVLIGSTVIEAKSQSSINRLLLTRWDGRFRMDLIERPSVDLCNIVHDALAKYYKKLLPKYAHDNRKVAIPFGRDKTGYIIGGNAFVKVSNTSDVVALSLQERMFIAAGAQRLFILESESFPKNALIDNGYNILPSKFRYKGDEITVNIAQAKQNGRIDDQTEMFYIWAYKEFISPRSLIRYPTVEHRLEIRTDTCQSQDSRDDVGVFLYEGSNLRGGCYATIGQGAAFSYLDGDEFFISPELRKRGYGRQMLSMLENYGRENDINVLTMGTSFPAAYRLYQSIGAHVCFTIPNYLFDGGFVHLYSFRKAIAG